MPAQANITWFQKCGILQTQCLPAHIPAPSMVYFSIPARKHMKYEFLSVLDAPAWLCSLLCTFQWVICRAMGTCSYFGTATPNMGWEQKIPYRTVQLGMYLLI